MLLVKLMLSESSLPPVGYIQMMCCYDLNSVSFEFYKTMVVTVDSNYYLPTYHHSSYAINKVEDIYSVVPKSLLSISQFIVF